MNTKKMKIGIPNRGRLSSLCRNLLIDQLKILDEDTRNSRKYSFESLDKKTEIIFARSSNLPKLLYQGYIDTCITGLDYVLENQKELKEIFDLKFCPGDIYVLVPKEKTNQYKNITDLDGKKIATQLPNIAKKWLNDQKVKNAIVIGTDGANEVYPHINICDATIDMVATGETAKANNLIPVFKIEHSSGRLYCTKNSMAQYKDEISYLLEKISQLNISSL